jgi:hypothetical protein
MVTALARLLVVAVAVVAMILAGGVAQADLRGHAETTPAQEPPMAMVCALCVEDGVSHHCDEPLNHAVRDTAPHKEPRNAPGCGQPNVPAARSLPADLAPPAGTARAAPDLHLLQRLRV